MSSKHAEQHNAKYKRCFTIYNLHEETASWKTVTANEHHRVLLTGNDDVKVKLC